MIWGVTPMYQGDSASVGGLTRETAQTGMFENLIEAYQNVINRGAIPFILKNLGVLDWEISLVPPMERTEEDGLRLEKQRIENAQAMINLGYQATKTKGNEIRFTYEKSPMPMGQPGMAGGPPPMAGGGVGAAPGMLPGGEMPPPPQPTGDEE